MNIFGLDISKAEAAAKDSVEKGWVSSSRLLLVLAFGLLMYFAKSVFTTELFIILAAVLGLYMVCNTVTRVFEIITEGTIIKERQKLAWTDGVLTETEANALNSADALLGKTLTAPAIPTPKLAVPATPTKP